MKGCGVKMAEKVAYSAMLTALAMIFSYIEAVIPFSVGVPGIKLGLANLVVVTGLYFMSPLQVFTILIARIMLVSFLFGNMSAMLYSLAGGVLSFTVMLLIRKCRGFSIIGVSIAGGVCHNFGQLLIAMVVVRTIQIVYYLPVLFIAGMITGMLIGIVGQRIQSHIKY